ncbi:hypothetical protein COCVIDRAFT_31703 [Bipolaris victoriae FI3]|uniref:Uncharacterized protein n=1 Tax=Bipolaris victoriae (strain FI3) TaxID=930091 RepID=W7E4Y0_BIPV3|nr:hypothetical protein COCVIDRAFT_31703 [Bipolaris victoriae FI3]
MSARTYSATVIASPYTYIFVNRPDTDHTDVIQFKTGDESSGKKQGKLTAGGNVVVAKEGPIAALQYYSGDNTKVHHVVLYFFGDGTGQYSTKPNEVNAAKKLTEVNEAKLDNASEPGTNPLTGWRVAGTDITLQRTLGRQVDSSSVLAATARGTQLNVVFTEKDKPDDVRYQWYDGKQWNQSIFPLNS